MIATERYQALLKIAGEKLRVPTLETRGSDRLDFHEVSVWSILEALEEAYKLGVVTAAAEAAKLDAVREDVYGRA